MRQAWCTYNPNMRHNNEWLKISQVYHTSDKVSLEQKQCMSAAISMTKLWLFTLKLLFMLLYNIVMYNNYSSRYYTLQVSFVAYVCSNKFQELRGTECLMNLSIFIISCCFCIVLMQLSQGSQELRRSYYLDRVW